MKKSSIAIISGLIGSAVGGYGVARNNKNVINAKDEKIYKFKSYYNVLNQWLELKQKGKSIDDYFVKKNYKRVAIYGLGEMGTRLMDDLSMTSIEIVYGMDKNIDNAFGKDLQIYSIDEIDLAEHVDAMVVSAIFVYYDICNELKDKIDCDIVSLEEIIRDCYEC